MNHFASLPEHCQCYPREDVFPIFSLGSVREIHSLGKYFSVHSLGHSEYQEIHTFSALNIDSVKINTSLLMMRECVVFNGIVWYCMVFCCSLGCCVVLYDITRLCRVLYGICIELYGIAYY